MKILRKIKNLFDRKSTALSADDAQTHFAHGEDFSIDKRRISQNVRKITQRLTEAKYEAYLVGGGVRDLLLHHAPKDFDVATDATPEQIRKQFRNCRIIGRRFRLAHVYFKDELIEVSTFRAQQSPRQHRKHVSEQGMVLRDNTYGDLKEDAWRRDFTINALYYDLQNDLIIDYTGGLEDIKDSVIRIIGDATLRYREDPVRMLRALRFAAKLDFEIAPATAEPITALKDLIWNVPPSRLFEEVLKLFFTGHAYKTYQVLQRYGYFSLLFPHIEAAIDQLPYFAQLIEKALINTDDRIKQDKSINPAFLLGVLLWGPFQLDLAQQKLQQPKLFLAQQQAADKVITQQLATITIPKRFTQTIKEIWEMQFRLPKRYGKRAHQTLAMRRFRAAYDFLVLRGEVDKKHQDLANWWTLFQEVNEAEQATMLAALPKSPRKK